MYLSIKISKKNFYAVIATSISFICSILISPFHFEGDQIVYNKIYDLIKNTNFEEALQIYRGLMDSREVGHFLYIFFFASIGVEKILSMAIANAILTFLSVRLVYDYLCKSPWIIFFTTSNLYLLTLFFSIERLKIAFIFFAFALINFRKKIVLYIFAIMSLLSHFSMIIPLGLYFFVKIIINRLRFYFSYINIIILFLIIFILVTTLSEIYDHILRKITAYFFPINLYDSIISAMKTSFFLLGSIFVSGTISWVIAIVYFPLIIFSFVIEAQRFNIFAYLFLLFFCAISSNTKRSKLVLIITSLYYSVMGLIYISRVVTEGS